MKYIVIVCIIIVTLFSIFICGYLYGKQASETKIVYKMVDATSNIKNETERLKNEINNLREKLKNAKNEECDFILNYPVRDKCL